VLADMILTEDGRITYEGLKRKISIRRIK